MAPAIEIEYGALDGSTVVGKGSIGTFLDPVSSIMSIDRLRPQHIVLGGVC